MWQPGWEGSLGRMDTCVCMAESFTVHLKLLAVLQCKIKSLKNKKLKKKSLANMWWHFCPIVALHFWSLSRPGCCRRGWIIAWLSLGASDHLEDGCFVCNGVSKLGTSSGWAEGKKHCCSFLMWRWSVFLFPRRVMGPPCECACFIDHQSQEGNWPRTLALTSISIFVSRSWFHRLFPAWGWMC